MLLKFVSGTTYLEQFFLLNINKFLSISTWKVFISSLNFIIQGFSKYLLDKKQKISKKKQTHLYIDVQILLGIISIINTGIRNKVYNSVRSIVCKFIVDFFCSFLAFLLRNTEKPGNTLRADKRRFKNRSLLIQPD